VELIFFVLEIPNVVVLTKIDKRDEMVKENAATAFQSKPIKDIVMKVSESFGIPEYLVYPVKSYTNEFTLDTGVNILSLLALRQMLFCAEDHIDNTQMRRTMSAIRLGGADHENASEAI